uniref:cation:proton antiporter family protein n=1 Tax=Thaumasiovibrio occultus TaxID=1891184 RepID=UPI000B354153|nr:cation:proton antiporter family protein [Thaumasiovibrio occultus]
MELIYLSAAFWAGFLALRCKLPPLVGFLVAGFALRLSGYAPTEELELAANLGVTLLLFTIGLKLNAKNLLKGEIWGGATVHNLGSTAIFALLIYGLKWLNVPLLSEFTWHQVALLSFALAFSSTVFAIKILQEKGELNAIYGNLAIGILVMQDIFAVVFMTISTGKVPEITALLLFALPLLRPLLYRLLDWAGHGEVLVLLGIFMALVFGVALFQFVGLKPDLGALIVGMLLAGHSKSSELSKSLFNMKELLLVCFFLNIGLSATPSVEAFKLALIFLLLLPLKGALYFGVFRLFRFRLRTVTFGTLSLFNYSEFGLIVGGLAFKKGWMSGDILAAIAIAVSLSFIFASLVNANGYRVYQWVLAKCQEIRSDRLNAKDQSINLGDAQVLVLGMGRIGTGAYDELSEQYNGKVIGIDTRVETVDHHQRHGRNTLIGDAVDVDFWERVSEVNIELILLAMPHSQANALALTQIKELNFKGRVAAIAKYPDEAQELLEMGADAAFNIYREAGAGFARHVKEQLT